MDKTDTGAGFEYCVDLAPARWLLDGVDQWDLNYRGPSGFESYARCLFLVDPRSATDNEVDAPFATQYESILDLYEAILRRLQPYSSSSSIGNFLLRPSGACTPSEELQQAPKMMVAAMECALVRGPLYDLSSWCQDLDVDEADHPYMVWPDDHSWCIVQDSDTRYFALAGSEAAITTVSLAPDLKTKPWRDGEHGSDFIFKA